MSFSEKILGQKINEFIMRRTFYGQFVAGNSLEEINESSGLLKKCGVRPMLAVPIEENVARKNDELFYDENLEKILTCLKLSEEISDNRKMMQVRITAFINPDILVRFQSVLKFRPWISIKKFYSADSFENSHWRGNSPTFSSCYIRWRY